MLRLDRRAEPEEARRGLEILRLAGDERSLRLAVRRLISDGPATAVTLAAASLRLDTSTRTTGSADLALLQYGGDLLDQTTADRAVAWLVAALDDSSAFARRTNPSYRLGLRLIDTLAGVILAASPTAQANIIDLLAKLDAQKDVAFATSWAGVVSALPTEAWSEKAVLQIERHVNNHDFPLKFALLPLMARYSASTRLQLMEEVRGGSVAALAALGDVRNLPADIAEAMIDKLTQDVDHQIRQANSGHYEFGGVDVGRELSLLNMWHPSIANWDPVLRLLADDAADAYKDGAMIVLAAMPDRLPAEIRTQLEGIARAIVGQSPSLRLSLFGDEGDMTGVAVNLAVALGVYDVDASADKLLELLNGDSRRQQWAAVIARRMGDPESTGVLVTLTQAQDPDVRAVAAASLARLVATGHDVALGVSSLRCSLHDPGTKIPAAIVNALNESPNRTPTGDELLNSVLGHMSAKVRTAAARALLR